MNLLLIGYIALSNVIWFLIVHAERRYSKHLLTRSQKMMEGWEAESKWWNEVCTELSDEVTRLRDR